MDEKIADGAVRVMTQREKAEYEDITIEDIEDVEDIEHGGSADTRRGTDSAERPRIFDEVYEDNSQKSQNSQGRQRGNFHFAGRSSNGTGVRFYRIGFGNSVSPWQKWKYRIIGALVAVAVIWFLIFVALPVVAIGVVAAMIAYMLYSFFA